MMNYLMIFQAILAVIRSVEVLMPDSPGKEKFDAAIGSVSSVVGDEKTVGALGQMINAGVALFNAVGEFKHK